MSCDDDPERSELPTDGGPQPLRYPCPWCQRPEAWPDRCAEELRDIPGPKAFRCAATIEKHCARGDHRRCAVGACTVSSRWHEPVRLAAIVAARAMNRVWVIVSTVHNGVELAGTADELEHAERLRRRTLFNAGREDNAEGRGLVYVVRGSDGAFV